MRRKILLKVFLANNSASQSKEQFSKMTTVIIAKMVGHAYAPSFL